MTGHFDHLLELDTNIPMNTQFRNPYDDLDEIAKNQNAMPAYYTRNNVTNQTFEENNRSLVNDFEIIDKMMGVEIERPHSSEGILVDVNDDFSQSSSVRSDYPVIILINPINGLKFDTRGGIVTPPRSIQIPPGVIMRPVNENDHIKNSGLKGLKSARNEMLAPMEDIVDPSICGMVTSGDVMRITHNHAMQLLSINICDRLSFYRDIDRFNFVANLKIGDFVLLDINSKMKRVPGHISWIGERPKESGIWYNVDFDEPISQWSESYGTRLNNQIDWNSSSSFLDMSGSSSVAPSNSRLYFSPNQMHMPLKGGGVPTYYDERRAVDYTRNDDHFAPKVPPRERIIPITRKDEPHDSGRSRTGRLSPDSLEFTATSASAQPSRSKSVHSMQHKCQNETTKNPIRVENLGFRIGDACVWNNNGIDEKGTIKFIGYLKGHKELYAGVEFKNPIGAGTGIFNKEQLFHAKEGHAGFVELSSLEQFGSSSSSTSSSASQHRRRLSSSRSQNHAVATGATVSVPVNRKKQPSMESMSDVPPPPYTPPSPPRASSAASHHHQHPPPLPPKPTCTVEDYLIDSFEIGSQVQVCHLGAQRSGIVRWLGDAMNEEGNGLERSAIVQLDADVPTAWRRSNEVPNYTGSPIHGGVLVPVVSLRRNYSSQSTPSAFNISRVSPTVPQNAPSKKCEEFGSMDSGVEKTRCNPSKDIQQLVGRQKGIQGYCNSCYLDATLYAMFVQTTVFDFLLEKPIKSNEKAILFQKILSQEIVFPLRKFHYVRADHVMKLRKLLAELMPHMSGLTNEEKDPEEILGFIFSEIFRVEPFIKLIDKKSTDSQYLVPIVVDSDWQGGAATSQHLLERHMRSAEVRFARPPPVLIMQLPRYGQQKVFDKILPLERIDITPFVAGSVPACSSCGGCAEVYCPTCFLTRRVFFTDIVYCNECFKKSHSLPDLADHAHRYITPPGRPAKKPNSYKMILSAVLCIETSHYVAYVRTSSGQWVFFDSMADREGLSDGFNVPVVRECGDMSYWLSLSGWNRLKEADDTGQIKAMFGKSALDPLVSRLLSDSYICFYEDASNNSSNGGGASSALINTIRKMI